MATDELLTKDEMDALMEVVSSRKGNASGGPAQNAGEAQPYELVSPENALNGVLPILGAIQERFAHRLRVGLFELLRRDVEVTANSIEVRSYNDLIASLTVPCSLNIISMLPLSGPGLLVFDRQLVFMVVDTFFGGTGRPYSHSNLREFTVTEHRFIQRLLKLALHCLEAAWKPFTPVHCTQLGVESNPQFVTVINPVEMIVAASLQVQKDDNIGIVHLALPCSMFEPVRATLLASLYKEHPSRSERLTRLLRDGVKDSLVDIRCLLMEIELTVRELLSLRAGDFIPMDIPDSAVLEIEGIPAYKGHYGVVQGWRAVKVEQVLTSIGNTASYSDSNEDPKP